MGRSGRGYPATRDWILTSTFVVLLVVYFSSFWGQAALLLPAPLDDWYGVFYRILTVWWHLDIAAALPGTDSFALYSIVEAFILGFLIPFAALKIAGRSLMDMGLARPKLQAMAVFFITLVVAIATGFWLSAAVTSPWGTPLYEVLELLSMVPEHFFFFAVVLMLMLPERRLVKPTSLNRQSGLDADSVRFPELSWRFVRLNERETFAVVISAALFQLAHAGTQPLEALLSFPAGLVFAYLTLSMGSIWPALLIHWVLNLIPYSWYLLVN